MFLDLGVDQGAAVGLQLGERPLLIRLHEPAGHYRSTAGARRVAVPRHAPSEHSNRLIFITAVTPGAKSPMTDPQARLAVYIGNRIRVCGIGPDHVGFRRVHLADTGKAIGAQQLLSDLRPTQVVVSFSNREAPAALAYPKAASWGPVDPWLSSL
jgi:hypothetical protein